MAEAKVYISGPIVGSVKEAEEQGFSWPLTLLDDVRAQIEWQKPFDAVRVIINSPGGRVDVGMGIYDLLRSLGGVTITTEAIGQCSSIATAVLLAGSVRLIHPHTESLVHLPSGTSRGTAEQIQAFADEMALCQQQLIDLYVERAGIDEAVALELMRAETVLTAEQMVQYGFATKVLQPITALATLAPKTATSAADAAPNDQMPGWAQQLMSKFNQALAGMKSALSGATTRPTAQADAEGKTALDVTTDGGDTLTIDTGDRATYQVGDTVTAADGNAAADGDYVLTDGNTITVAAGAISAITEPSTDASATASADTDAAITQLVEAVTALAGEVRGIKTAQATQAQTMTRLASATGSNGRPPRPTPTNDSGNTDTDPVKTAADNRAARREARYKGN